jgi:hypothetical protein
MLSSFYGVFSAVLLKSNIPKSHLIGKGISSKEATPYDLRFTPLESPSIYAGDGGNRKHQLLIEGGVKALPFLTGFTTYDF